MTDHLKLRERSAHGPLERGTGEWDQREALRQAAGCQCIGFGSIPPHETTVRMDVRNLRRWRLERMELYGRIKVEGLITRPKEVDEDGDEGEERYGS